MLQNPIFVTVLVGFMTSLGGWIFLYIGLTDLRDARKRQEAERRRATAKVVDVVAHKHTVRNTRRRLPRKISVTVWKPVVEFDVEDRTYRVESPEPFEKGELPVGSSEEVLYDPEDPTHFHLERIGRLDFHKAWFCVGIGIATLVFAAFATREICGSLW